MLKVAFPKPVVQTAKTVSDKSIRNANRVVADRFLRSRNDKLLGVRGNIAVIEDIVYGSKRTRFYDITKPIEEALLKIRLVSPKTKGLPLMGPQSVVHPINPKQTIKQRKDVYPHKTKTGDTETKVYSYVYDENSRLIREEHLKAIGGNETTNNIGRIVKSKCFFSDGSIETRLTPQAIPNNTTWRGYSVEHPWRDTVRTTQKSSRR